jgi:hypothetical protein
VTLQRRNFCIKFDPRQEVELLRSLSQHGQVTADKSGTVFWSEVTMTEREIEALPGVVKAIEYIRPLWADVLLGQTPPPTTKLAADWNKAEANKAQPD